MKRIISLIIILISIMIPVKTSANPFFRAEVTGFPIVTDNSVSANVNLTYVQVGFSSLFVMAADEFITNNDNPNIKIPIQNLYLLADGQEFQIGTNNWQRFFIDNFDITGTSQKNITLKLENIGELPAGNYTVLLKFLDKTGFTLDYECELFFTFMIDEKHTITVLSGDPVIILTDDDIFNFQNVIRNQNDIRLDLTSNTKWKLWLDTANLEDENCEYYCQLKNASGKVSSYNQERIRIISNQRYLLASGEETLEGIDVGNRVPTNVLIEYSLKNTSTDKYIKEGIRQNPFTYILERE